MKPFILFFLLISSIFLHSQQALGIYQSAGGENNIFYVYSDILNVRQGPGIEYEITDKLKIGDEVILSTGFKWYENSQTYTQNGITAFWFPVSYQKNEIQKQGYVWQGNLSFTQMRRGSTKFIYGINAMELIREKAYDGNSYDTYKYKVELKVLGNDSLIAKKTFTTYAEQTYTKANVFENLGLKDIKNIVRISFMGEACGIPTFHYYFAWNGKELLDLPSRYAVSDAGVYYYSEEFIFPLEKDGKPDRIIKKSEEVEFEEDENFESIDFENIPAKRKTEEYLWNGKNYKKTK